MRGPLTCAHDFVSTGAFPFAEYAIQPLGVFPTPIELLLFHMRTLIEHNAMGALPKRNSQFFTSVEERCQERTLGYACEGVTVKSRMKTVLP